MLVAVPSTTQVIVELVAPATSEVAVAVTSVSGESVNETPVGVPLLQLAEPTTVTDLEAVSIA